jgi:methylated-DNA-[protein]-cysteine S-methyltransferase
MPTPFQERVYALIRQIPEGRVSTYADIAHAMGTGAHRAVGTALARNPDIPATPCHRVVKSDGHVGQYAFNTPKKIALLKGEGVRVVNSRVVDFERKRFQF